MKRGVLGVPRPAVAARLGLTLLGALAACRDPEAASRPERTTAARPNRDAGTPTEGTGARCPSQAVSVTVDSLLSEMGDLPALARRSPAPFRVFEFSSYDRRSVRPDPPDQGDDQTGWFANHDWGHFLRVERSKQGRTEYVVLDVAGPGAIVRFWSATPQGRLRFYLDDLEQPVFDTEMADLLTGKVAPFTPPFGEQTAAGGNLDFPFPFKERAKVTIEGTGEALFYQAFVRRYEPGCVDVVTYAPAQVKADALARARAALLEHQRLTDPAEQQIERTMDETDGTFELAATPGGSEIVELRMIPSDTSAVALRQSILSFSFDGVETARVPLGDFFGAGPGLLPHKTLPLEVTSEGQFISRFVMPFADSATIRLTGTQGLSVRTSVRVRPRPYDAGTYHFYAQWIARGPISVRPFRDLTVTGVTGQGRYVGTTLSLNNSDPMWWGEGDEKVWVDDDIFPSWFGTGTEDYFGYAYNTRVLFDHPLRSQSLVGVPASGGYDYRGRVANARYHLLDAIPFQRQIRFDLELWHWASAAQVDYDTTAYFYVRDGATLSLPFAEPADFRLPPPVGP